MPPKKSKTQATTKKKRDMKPLSIAAIVLAFIIILTVLLYGAATWRGDERRPAIEPVAIDETEEVVEDVDEDLIDELKTALLFTKPSRDAWEGCEWQEVGGYGIRFLSQKCPTYQIVQIPEGFTTKFNTGVSDIVEIEIIDSNEGMTAEETIQENFIDTLDEEAQENCSIEIYNLPTAASQKGVTRYVIKPSEEYWEQLLEDEEYPTFNACGDKYGTTNGVQYFEVHENSPDRFLFVRIGQDMPLFDEASIEFIDNWSGDIGTECVAAGGNWLADYEECEYVSEEWCDDEGGEFYECESACRHNPEAEICTLQCVVVCKF